MTGRNGNSANTTTGDGPRCQRERASLWQLAGIFLRVGATGFGGMTSLLALIHHYVRDRYNLVDEDEFSEAVAVGQILPGPIVVDAATHIGYTLRGWLGALVTTTSIILPPAALILLLSPIYFANQNSTLLAGALRGIEAAVVAAVVVAAWKMAQPVLGSWLSMLIAAASFLLLALTPVHPVAVVLVAGAIGAATLRPPGEGDRKPAAKREGASE